MEMDAETETALRGSIEKWRLISIGRGADEGSRNCPLCQMFIARYDDDGRVCSGCPVRRSTGKVECQGTPYVAWRSLHLSRGPISRRSTPFRAETDEQRAAALEEMRYLESLLPTSASSPEDFSFSVDDHLFEMTDGLLTVDGVEYERESYPEIYAIAIARHRLLTGGAPPVVRPVGTT